LASDILCRARHCALPSRVRRRNGRSWHASGTN
jgi:hypothetical protein